MQVRTELRKRHARGDDTRLLGEEKQLEEYHAHIARGSGGGSRAGREQLREKESGYEQGRNRSGRSAGDMPC